MTLERDGDEARSNGALVISPDARRSVAPSLAETVMTGLLPGIATLADGGRHSRHSGGENDPRPEVAPPVDERNPEPFLEWAVFGLPKYRSEDLPDWPQRKLAEIPSEPGALGEYLEQLPPGERLAKLLAAIDVAEVDDFSLVEVVAAFKRMEAWSAARAARAAGALAEREALNPTWPGSLPGRTRGECVVGEELAMRLRVSRLSAVRMVASGRGFARMFAPTGEALEKGLIDFLRAQAIVTALEELPTDVAMAAQWQVLETAAGRTLRQLQQDLARAVIAVDPDHADARHRAARQKRRVHRPRPLPDGMAHVGAVLPAGDAIALDTALDAAARAARNNGDTRTLDQLRADSLALMGHTALVLGHIGPHTDARCTCGCTPQPSDSTSAPTDDSTPAPIGDSTRLPEGDGSPTPDDDSTPAPAGDSSPMPADGTRPPCDVGPPWPGHRLPGGRLSTIRLGMLAGGRADIRITVPLGVLLPDPEAPPPDPLHDEPQPVAELEGYGPVPPVIARALAAGGTWRRLVTDPTGTQVLDVGRTRYQPPPAIADHVRERDRTCTRPACTTPARSCDLDHEHEWQHGGATSADNLGPQCRRDHLIKSIGAFTVAHATDRTYAWTTPTGHGYLRRPDGSTITLPHRTAEGLRAAARRATRTGRHLAPAVVDAVLAEVSAGTDRGGSWTPAPTARAHTAQWPGVGAGPGWAGDDEPPF